MVSDSYSKESLRKTGENQKTTKIGYSESSKPFVTTEKNLHSLTVTFTAMHTKRELDTQ